MPLVCEEGGGDGGKDGAGGCMGVMIFLLLLLLLHNNPPPPPPPPPFLLHFHTPIHTLIWWRLRAGGGDGGKDGVGLRAAGAGGA